MLLLQLTGISRLCWLVGNSQTSKMHPSKHRVLCSIG